MPIPDTYRPIVGLLIDKTEEGVLHWTSTTLNLSVIVDDSRFAVWSGVDEETEEAFAAFALYSTSSPKPTDSWYVDSTDDDYRIVNRLYQAAKRNAAGVPNILKGLTERLSAMTKDAN